MMEERKNINRGYKKLVVWQDAIALYSATWDAVRAFQYDLKRVSSQQTACADSVHRNIAEGYCRRGIKEYLHHLNIALASLGEYVSALHAMQAAQQLSEQAVEELDQIAFKIENGLVRLIGSLQKKKEEGSWDDSFIVRESNQGYGSEVDMIPTFQYSTIPSEDVIR